MAAAITALAACCGWAQVSWSPAAMLSADDDESSKLEVLCEHVAAANGRVHVVWTDYRHGSQYHTEIYYRGSSSEGRDWGPEVRLTEGSAKSTRPSVAADGDYVHVTCRREELDRPIYLRSSDGGSTWDDERRVHSGLGDYYDTPLIAASNGSVHLLWANDSTIYYSHSGDNGTSWGEARTVVSGVEGLGGTCKHVAASGETVLVMYILDYQLHSVYSQDNGATWSEPQVLRNNLEPVTAKFSTFDVAVEGDRVYVATSSASTLISPGVVYVHVSANNGRTFGEAVQVSTGREAFQAPSIAVDGGVVHTTWYAHFDDRGQRYRASYDGGSNWTVIDTVDTARNLGGCSIAAENGVVHLLTNPSGEVTYQRAEYTTSVYRGAVPTDAARLTTRSAGGGRMAVLDVAAGWRGPVTCRLLNLRGEVVYEARMQPRGGRVRVEVPRRQSRAVNMYELSGAGGRPVRGRLVGF